jgi:uncharacterized repeat protein (TIGR01451 family)
MNNDAPERTLSRFLRATLLGLAAMGAWLGVPGLLSASETITCDTLPLIANPPQSDAQLGWTIAINKNENQTWLAAGANQDNAKAGSVSMYLNPGPGTPQTEPKIIPADLQPGDQFGASVSLSGNWLAVGAPVGDGNVRDSGVVYLFQRNGSTWVQQAKLDATDAAKGDQFGFSVSLSGTKLVVGAPGDSDRGSTSGSVYVFALQGAVWQQAPKLVAGDSRAFDKFGSAVAISGDEIVVGAPFADDLHVLQNFGAAYVFQRITNGGWTLENNGKLTAGAFRPGNIQFGSAVAIGGGRIVVGARGDDKSFADSGSAYVFERNGSGWTPHLLTSDDPKQGAQLGTAVQIDGERMLIGAPFDESNAGATYLFEKQSDASWQPKFKFLPDPGGAFGQSVAILGSRVFMGGFEYNMDAARPHAGAVATCSIPPNPMNKHLTCKKTGPESVDAGGLATYKITVTNDGDTAVAKVMLDDSTPAGLTFVRADQPCDRKFPCSLGTIPPGESVSKMVTFRVPAECSARGSFTNSATVTADGVEAITCTALPTAILSQPQKPFLSCDNQGPSSVRAGDIIDYKLTVSNTGCAAAKNVKLSDATPSGLTYVSGPCVQSPCNLGTIGPGQSLPPVMVRFQVPSVCTAPAGITNTATVTGSNAAPQACSLVTPVPPQIDLGVRASTDTPDPAVPGQGVVYNITVENTGATAVSGAVVRDDFPSELRKVLWCRGAGCTPSQTPPLEDTIDLAAGETRIYRLSGIVQPMCSGVLHNKATITPPAGVCDDPSDNQRVEDTQVVATGVHTFCAGISGPLTESTAITQTFLLINCGPASQADNPGAEFTDVLPAGLTLTSAGATSGFASTAGNTATWNGAIPVGGRVTVTLTANINAGTAGMTLCNQATTASDADGNGSNESAGVSDDPDQPGSADPCCFQVLSSPPAILPVPALSMPGLAALALLLAGFALLRLRRRFS